MADVASQNDDIDFGADLATAAAANLAAASAAAALASAAAAASATRGAADIDVHRRLHDLGITGPVVCKNTNV